MNNDLQDFLDTLYIHYYHIYKIIKDFVFVPVAKAACNSELQFIRALPSDENFAIPFFSLWCNKISMIIIDEKTKLLDNFCIYSMSLRYLFLPEHLNPLQFNWINIIRGAYPPNVKIIHQGQEHCLYDIIEWQKQNNSLVRYDILENYVDFC